MWIVLFLFSLIALLMVLQSVVLLAFKEPLQWTFGANSQQPKALKRCLQVILYGTQLGSLWLFPYLVGSHPAKYYGEMLPWSQAHLFLYGEGIALVLLTVIFLIEMAGGWIYWKPRWTAQKAWAKSSRSALSSITVVIAEEPMFRGIVLRTLLTAVPAVVAVPLSAVLFSAAHFIRKVSTYWPAVGLAVLGLWLGVGYERTGNLWLPMGLHSGGILAIGIHRCFLNYRGPAWLIGTQTFPIAGLISILVMLAGSAITWYLFTPR